MSKVNEEVQNENVKNSEEVVETTKTQEVAVVEKKKFNLGPKMKKGLKIAGIAGLGVLSFALGAKWGSRSKEDSEENVEEVDYEVIDEDVNE